MNTTKLIQSAKARFEHQASKKYLQEKYLSKLILPAQGGLWNISLELLSYLKSAPPTCVLMDSFNNPVEINSETLSQELENHYNLVMSEWYKEFSELSKNR